MKKYSCKVRAVNRKITMLIFAMILLICGIQHIGYAATPTFASLTGTYEIAENTSTVENIGNAVSATDPDGGNVTYTIPSNSLFSIGLNTGQLQTKTGATFDYETETSHDVVVTASDSSTPAQTATITVTITVTNVDEPPVFGTLGAYEIAENTSGPVNIGNPVSATDPEETTVTYTIPNNSLFSIGLNTGQLQTQTNVTFDHETQPTYSVVVTASDGSTPAQTATITVTISVTNVNEAPVFTEGSSITRAVLENTSAGVNIGDPVSATDFDISDTLTYTLGGPDAALFSIVSSTGQLQTKAALNYENKKTYTVVVTVSDGTFRTETITVTINITNIEEVIVVLNPAPVAQDRVIFNEIHNAANDNNDWLELKNISDEPVSLKDWEVSIVTPSQIQMFFKPENAGKDVDIVAFPDYTLPAGGILLIVNTPPSDTDLISGQDISKAESKPGVPPQYLVAPEMQLPNTPYLLILRHARDKNGKPEAFEDVAGNYFRGSVAYNTQVWPLRDTLQPWGLSARLTQGKAWQRVAVDQRGYTGKAWALSGYQSGLGYRPKASAETSLGTPGYANARIVSEIPTRQISVSELMFTSQGGIFSLPQWIELYNNSNTEVVNIEGWKLAVETRDATGHHRYLVIVLEALEVLPNQTVLLVTGVRRDSGHFPTSRIYNLYRRHTNAFVQYRYPNSLLSASGFAVKLSLSDDTLVDLVGNLDGKKSRDAPSWELPSSETTEGVRTSLIRRYENRLPLSGTVVSSWVRAADTALIGVHTYWGSPMDNGTPGYRQGGPLPVTLSNFRADRTELGVVLEWRTESEVENAGFNILRSQTR